jgi:hypothetical protein
VAPAMVAVNCCVPPFETVAIAGDTVTPVPVAGGGVGVGLELLPPPHPERKETTTKNNEDAVVVIEVRMNLPYGERLGDSLAMF